MLGHDGVIPVATAENATVYLGMQGLDPAVHHLGEAGVVGDLGHRQARIGQQLGGTTGGEQATPRASSALANSRMPVLSDTLSSARRWVELVPSHYRPQHNGDRSMGGEAQHTESPQIKWKWGFRKPLARKGPGKSVLGNARLTRRSLVAYSTQKCDLWWIF